jgi:hypothetical protein
MTVVMVPESRECQNRLICLGSGASAEPDEVVPDRMSGVRPRYTKG